MTDPKSVEDLARELDEVDWEPRHLAERSRRFPRRRRPGSVRGL